LSKTFGFWNPCLFNLLRRLKSEAGKGEEGRAFLKEAREAFF
jgi:hypothetical protein